jgi:hypothetical protein
VNQDVASKHWGCTHFEDRHGVVIRTKVSYKLVKRCQALLLELKLTGHFNDIFCGPAIMSSSSVMACTTGEAGQQQPLEEGRKTYFSAGPLVDFGGYDFGGSEPASQC